MFTVSFDFPNLPKDGEIDIHGIEGILKNGHTYKISDAAGELYQALNPVVSADGTSAPGASLTDAFEANPHVTVVFTEGGNV